jgi:hypothetical protein
MTATPKAISKRLRFEIYRRDNHTCRYCGASAPGVKLTVDHVIPVTLGGSDEPFNLVTACTDCNNGKSSIAPDSPIVEGVADDTLRWARAMRCAAELQAAQQEKADAYVATLDHVWCQWTVPAYGDARQRSPVHRPDNWRDSLERFHSLGLEMSVAANAMQTALNNDRIKSGSAWRYFCGICWRRLEERQQIARDMLDTGAVE